MIIAETFFFFSQSPRGTVIYVYAKKLTRNVRKTAIQLSQILATTLYNKETQTFNFCSHIGKNNLFHVEILSWQLAAIFCDCGKQRNVQNYFRTKSGTRPLCATTMSFDSHHDAAAAVLQFAEPSLEGGPRMLNQNKDIKRNRNKN